MVPGVLDLVVDIIASVSDVLNLGVDIGDLGADVLDLGVDRESVLVIEWCRRDGKREVFNHGGRLGAG